MANQYNKTLSIVDISTPSDTDSESDETQPSEIEFRILQKELDNCLKQKDDLKQKNLVNYRPTI